MGKLFLLFVIMPIAEIAVLINVGDIIGGWNTVAIVILSALIGAYLVKREGALTMLEAQRKMANGEVPAAEIGSGLLLLIAGVLLVTPGFITDCIGLLLTLPMTRKAMASKIMSQLAVSKQGSGFYANFSQGGFNTRAGGFGSDASPFSSTQQQHARNDGDDDIIEGEYTDADAKSPSRLDVFSDKNHADINADKNKDTDNK